MTQHHPKPASEAAALRRILSDLKQLDASGDFRLILEYVSAKLDKEETDRVRERLDYHRLLERLAAVDLGHWDPPCLEEPRLLKDRSRRLVVYDLGHGWVGEVIRRSGAWLGSLWLLQTFTTPEGVRYEVGAPDSDVEHLLQPHRTAVRTYTPQRVNAWPMVKGSPERIVF
ncbi:MAG: hypothetical protein AAFS10_25600 [Myxococcota bacterium]